MKFVYSSDTTLFPFVFNRFIFAKHVIEEGLGKGIKVSSSQPVPLEFDGELTGGEVNAYEVHVLEGANLLVVDRHSPYFE